MYCRDSGSTEWCTGVVLRWWRCTAVVWPWCTRVVVIHLTGSGALGWQLSLTLIKGGVDPSGAGRSAIAGHNRGTTQLQCTVVPEVYCGGYGFLLR